MASYNCVFLRGKSTRPGEAFLNDDDFEYSPDICSETTAGPRMQGSIKQEPLFPPDYCMLSNARSALRKTSQALDIMGILS